MVYVACPGCPWGQPCFQNESSRLTPVPHLPRLLCLSYYLVNSRSLCLFAQTRYLMVILGASFYCSPFPVILSPVDLTSTHLPSTLLSVPYPSASLLPSVHLSIRLSSVQTKLACLLLVLPPTAKSPVHSCSFLLLLELFLSSAIEHLLTHSDSSLRQNPEIAPLWTNVFLSH